MKKELNNVHFLRGMASLAVCIFHLFCGNIFLFPSSSMKTFFSFGYLGVEVFFILSGFIICYSLPDFYSSKNYFQFLFKRIVRIHPPYVASIALVIILNLLSWKITGAPGSISIRDIVTNFFYLNNFGSGDFLNVVYWTLGIEFQFYLIIGIANAYTKSKWSIFLLILSMIGVSCIPVPQVFSLVSTFSSIFSLGITTYYFLIKRELNRTEFTVLLTLGLLQIYFFFDIPVLLACLFALVVLFFWKYNNKIINFLSTISFSLYLTHTAIGGKVINLGLRWVHSQQERYFLFLLALSVSLIAAYIFYLVIEKPFIKYSKKIVYSSYKI